MTRIEQRLERLSAREPHVAQQIFEAIQRRGSERRGRPIEWPRPKFLDSPDVAPLQRDEGYRAEPQFDPVPLPIDWGENPFRDRSWANRLMCLQPMDAYLIGYEHDRDREWLRRALDVYFSWCDFHLVRGRKAYLSWYDMPVGYRAIKTSMILCEGLEDPELLTQSERELLVLSAEAHMGELLRPEALSLGNHGIFQLHGLAILAQVFWALPRSEEALAYTRTRLPELLRRQFNDEGVHLEHSPHYHQWMMGELTAIDESGWHERFALERTLSAAEEVRAWLVQPDLTPVRVGDTASYEPWPDTERDPTPDLIGPGCVAKWYPKGGYAIARSQTGQVFFQGSYHSTAHKHADDMHFEWFDLGRRILVDSGTAGYKGGEARQYFLSTAAHNTVVVDGQSYPRDGTDAYGSCVRDVSLVHEGIQILGEVDHASLGWTHEREIAWHPGRELSVVDTVSCRTPREVAVWLNFAPEFRRHDDHLFCSGDFHVTIEAPHPYRWSRGSVTPYSGWRAAGIGRMVPAWSGRMVIEAAECSLRTLLRLTPASEGCRAQDVPDAVVV